MFGLPARLRYLFCAERCYMHIVVRCEILKESATEGDMPITAVKEVQLLEKWLQIYRPGQAAVVRSLW